MIELAPQCEICRRKRELKAFKIIYMAKVQEDYRTLCRKCRAKARRHIPVIQFKGKSPEIRFKAIKYCVRNLE